METINNNIFDLIDKDVFKIIVDKLSIEDKINLWSIPSKKIRKYLKIYEINEEEIKSKESYYLKYKDTDLFSELKVYDCNVFIDLTKYQYLERIDMKRLSQDHIDSFECLPNLKQLSIVGCKKITNLNNLKSLIHLEAYALTKLGNNPKVDFDSSVFCKLKLQVLNVGFNPYVKDISCLKPSLKKLFCASSGLNQEAIEGFDLILIDCNNSDEIKDLTKMKNLKCANISGTCGVDQKGILGLDLVSLLMRNNNNIYDIRWMKNLKFLDMMENHTLKIDEMGLNINRILK